MADYYAKLAKSILQSSVWCEPDTTRLAWITLLAMKDQNGDVFCSIPGLANTARISIPAAVEAIECFMAPDPYSRTKEHEGRRICEIPGGWRVLNADAYKNLRSPNTKTEYMRGYMRQRRAGEKSGGQPEGGHYDFTQSDAFVSFVSPDVSRVNRELAHTDTDIDTDKSKSFSSEASASTLLSSDDDSAPDPIPRNAHKTERQRAFAQAAVDAYNAKLTGEAGKLSAVTILSGARIKQANRCASLAAAFIRANFPKGMSARQFWALYFTEVDRDDFKSGRLKPKPGNGHDKWRPNFDYLTRESVVTQVLDDAMSRTDDDEGGE